MTTAAAEPTRPTSREDDPTSTGYIVALAGAPLSVAGSKSAHLGELLAAGFPVPDGFVVTTAAFSSHLARAGLGDDASTDALIAADVPTDVESAIRAQYARLGDVPVAVRSSSLSEDLAGASFAGQHETTLDVRGADAVVAAVRKCWASAFDARVTAYRRAIDGAAPPSMAVLVQRMVPAESAGVAFSADPVTGDRDLVVVSAVRGLGERLVSGQSFDDEWAVKGDSAERRRRREDAIDATVAKRVAELARRVQSHMGAPQDIEWACVGGEIHLLQARPITALPEQVRWEAPGCWLRNFRLGEWIGAPVTPSFETWLLDRIEQRMHGLFTQWTGFSMAGPAHVVLNGWYFYGMNYFPKTALGNLKMMLSMVVVLALRFRRIAGLFPPLAHLGVDWWVREWREQTLPEYRKAVSDAASRVEHAEPRQLVEMIDDLATHAGTYFTSMVAIAGYAAKAEMPLAKHWHAHLSSIDVSYLELVRGTTSQSASPAPHAIEGLDWVLPTAGER
ncbi:MAG: hypothetical protein IT379_21915, partial [Deltaproteobacteria bacterium]|nr:hypothetical protein [Deltaproteobacteria bacterium]